MHKKTFFEHTRNETQGGLQMMNILQKICLAFTILGGLNWGMVGLFDFNLVTAIFGADSIMSKIVYVIIAICAIVNILIFFIPLHQRNEHSVLARHSHE